jgi:hypothetical protein
MTVPTISPTLKPFRQAINFHRSRVPLSPGEFNQLSNAAKQRAFTVSGLARQASIIETYRMAERALESGMTMKEFRKELGAYLEANEGAALSDTRLDLIFRQAITLARSVGRYEQMTDPDVMAARPYWMYPLGPDDDRTTTVCRRLQGFIAPAKAEVWNHIYPPNHFNERHNQVVTLTAAQAKATGRIYEGPDTDEYPFAGGGRAMPDPGFDFSPNLLASDGEQLLREVANLGDELAAKTAADYGLPDLAELPAELILEAPSLLEGLSPTAGADDIESAWGRFRGAFGIADGVDSTIIVDADGDGLFVNRQTFEHLVGEDTTDPNRKMSGASRAQFFNFLKPTVENPLEIWWAPRLRDGQTVFTKVYLARFADEASDRGFQVFVVRSPEGWLMWSGYPSDPRRLDRLRKGYLSYRGYGRSKAAA